MGGKMPMKEPTEWTAAAWALVILIGMAGGMIRFLRNFRDGHPRTFSIFEFVVELLTSAFISVVVAMGVVSLGFDLAAAAAAGGVSGHYGIRSLYLLQNAMKKRIENTNGK